MSSLNDTVGGANMYGGSNFLFTYDRFCSVNSAIYLNSGYLQVPPGVYFCGDFTTTFWIQIKIQVASDVRVLDFTNLLSNIRDDDITHYIKANTNRPVIEIWSQTSLSTLSASVALQSNIWYHVAFVAKSSTVTTYVNGIKVAGSSNMYVANCVNRIYNYFGHPKWSNTYINAVLDEMKIYDGALDVNQILSDYTLSSSGGKF